MSRQPDLFFSVHVPNLLKEILECGGPGLHGMKIPMNVFRVILGKVATRASELHDHELDKLMMQMALYDVADPTSSGYDPKIVDEYLYPTKTNEQNIQTE